MHALTPWCQCEKCALESTRKSIKSRNVNWIIELEFAPINSNQSHDLKWADDRILFCWTQNSWLLQCPVWHVLGNLMVPQVPVYLVHLSWLWQFWLFGFSKKARQLIEASILKIIWYEYESFIWLTIWLLQYPLWIQATNPLTSKQPTGNSGHHFRQESIAALEKPGPQTRDMTPWGCNWPMDTYGDLAVLVEK